MCLVEIEAEAPQREDLARGAASARRVFSTSGCLVVGDQWHWQEGTPELTEAHEVKGDTGAWAAAETLAAQPFSPRETLPVRQQWLTDSGSGRRWLATRLHHALADGLSTIMWLHHQLQVAAGLCEPCDEPQEVEAPRLKQHDAAVGRNRFAFSGAAGRLWSPHRRYSGARRLSVKGWDAQALESAVVGSGVRVNDLLGSSVLEAARRFNRSHGAGADDLGLWLPVNIREQPFEGFGNGSSRVRVYGRWPEEASALERCQAFREQVGWAREHGEWHVDTTSALFGLPAWLRDGALRAWLKRPWVDMGSLPFSHMERLGAGDPDRALPGVVSLGFLGLLHERFPVATVAATLRGTTWLSLTWDPALWGEAEISGFRDLLDATVVETREALSCAG